MKNNKELSGKTILIVHTGLIHKRFIFPKLKKMGLKVIVLHFEKTSIDPYVDHWIIANLNNQKECLDCINNFLKNNPDIKIDGVVTFWEESTLLTSRIADNLNLIGIPYSVTLKARNKFNFRKFCFENNIKAPKFEILPNEESIDKACNNLNFPVVVKPIFGSSSAFVVKVEDKKELKDIFRYVKNNVSSHPDSAEWDDLSIMAEEYIDGDEVDIDMIVQNGKIKFYSIADNYQTKEPFFLETGYALPSSLPEEDQKKLIDMAEESLEKLGVTNGCIHFEAKSTKNGAVPIEVNLRMGGDEIYPSVKSVWGVDLIENTVKIAIGEFIKINKSEPKKYVRGKSLSPEKSGIISQLDIEENLEKIKFVEEIHFDKKVGDVVLTPPEGYEFLGWITASGEHSLDADENLEEVLTKISYKIAEFQPESSIGKTLRKSRFSRALLNKKYLINVARIENIKRISLKDQRKLKIGIAYNNNIDEKDQFFSGKKILDILNRRNYQAFLIDFNDYNKVFGEIQKNNPDLILNFCEKINGKNSLQPNSAALFESLQIPYSGSDSFTLALSMDKIRTKKLLTFHNLPTPKWDYVYDLNDEIRNDLKYPLIAKPSNSNNSFGINNNSVVTTKNELFKQLKKIVIDLGRPALVEEYIEGTEYDISIFGTEEEDLEVMPLSQSIFDSLPKDKWHIYSNNEKLNNLIKVNQPPIRLNKKLESLITEISLDTYIMLGCRDYGRIELRTDRDGNPYILELDPDLPIESIINPNNSTKEKERRIGDVLEKIISLTIMRYKTKLLK